MPKLTKKQNSKLSSRKTKKLLGGGSFFRNPFKSKKPKAEKIHTPEPPKQQQSIKILAESPYSHLQRERPINTAEQTLRKTTSRTLISHLNNVIANKLSPAAQANYFNVLKEKLGTSFTKEHLDNVIKQLKNKLQQNPNPNPNPTYARLQRASAPPLISASTSTPPQLPPPRNTVSNSADALSALIRSSSAGEPVVNGQKLEVMPNRPVKNGAFRGMTNSQAKKIVTINEELASLRNKTKLSSNNAIRIKQLLEKKTRNGNVNINPNELNLLKKALKVIAANQQKSPANGPANSDESLYSKVIPKGQRSVPVAPALPPRLGSNTSKNIRQGKSLVFNQGQQEKTEIYRRREENSIGSNKRIQRSMELKNQTRRSSHLNSYIKNLEELGNSSFRNKTRNTQTENSIMEKYLFNKNPEYINQYKLLKPTQQDIIRRRFLTYSPAEISRMAKDDDLYSIFYSELINKF